jgi:hypothetical protein
MRRLDVLWNSDRESRQRNNATLTFARQLSVCRARQRLTLLSAPAMRLTQSPLARNTDSPLAVPGTGIALAGISGEKAAERSVTLA